jgi:hypothetical protein
VTTAEKLERLVRILPGVAGYQDRERARETDKQLRMRLGDELKRVARDLEDDKRRLLQAGQPGTLPLLDGLAGKMEKLARMFEFATRGYSALFDLRHVDLKRLEQMYAFDLGVFDTLQIVETKAAAVHQAGTDPAALQRAGDDLERALDDLERAFEARRQLLLAE